MENIQILEIITVDNEPQNLRIVVQYELEGVRNETYIPYEPLADFINSRLLKKKRKALHGGMVEDVRDAYETIAKFNSDVLEAEIHGYLFHKFRVDLIIENRKLKDKNADLEAKLKRVKSGVELIRSVLIDTFHKYHSEAEEYQHQAKEAQQVMCSHAIYHGHFLSNWFESTVLDKEKDLPNEIRKSA